MLLRPLLVLLCLAGFPLQGTPGPVDQEAWVLLLPESDHLLARHHGTLLAWHPEAGFAVVRAPAGALLENPSAYPADGQGMAAGGAASTDPLLPEQWSLPAIQAPEVWNETNVDARSVRIAIVDSGLDRNHPDVGGVAVEPGIDYVDGDFDPHDANGHGTHVAGIIAAERNNGIGIAGILNATLLPIRVLDATGTGRCVTFALAVVEAVQRGARVINLSLQCVTPEPALERAIAYAEARGVVVVAAAGNFGQDFPEGCPAFPARLSTVLAVAAVGPDLSPWEKTCGGAIAAPGVSVLSLEPGGYGPRSGTSMAAPHVAAVAALAFACDPSLTASAVREAIAATALAPSTALGDLRMGAGLAQAADLLREVQRMNGRACVGTEARQDAPPMP